MTCNILFLLLYIPGVVPSHLISFFDLIDLIDVIRGLPVGCGVGSAVLGGGWASDWDGVTVSNLGVHASAMMMRMSDLMVPPALYLR